MQAAMNGNSIWTFLYEDRKITQEDAELMGRS